MVYHAIQGNKPLQSTIRNRSMSEPLPRYSVIIPTYNRAARVAFAIRSVLTQLMDGDELIVVDDGSTDDTSRVLSDFADRIVVLPSTHRGAGAARNLGIAHARNELVAFLDSDDIWLAGKLQLQRQLMAEQTDLIYCFGNFEVQLRDGTVKPRYLDSWPREHGTLRECLGTGLPYSRFAALAPGVADFAVYAADFYLLQLTGFFILTDTLVVRREAAGDALTFAEDLPIYEDLECFYRLARCGPGMLLDVELARQFDHGDGRLTECSGNERLDARLALLRRHWGRDPDFQSIHGIRYREELERILRLKAEHLIVLGRGPEAANVLRSMDRPPVSLRALASLPPRVTMAALRAYRQLRSLSQEVRRSERLGLPRDFDA